MVKKIETYTNHELLSMASRGPFKLQKERVIATYADPSNWVKHHCPTGSKCYWVWEGPVIVGYELAQWDTEDYPPDATALRL